jgi:hypothetical protein
MYGEIVVFYEISVLFYSFQVYRAREGRAPPLRSESTKLQIELYFAAGPFLFYLAGQLRKCYIDIEDG